MLQRTSRTWLKGLPANSIGSWVELKARFIQNFKDTCKKPMSIVDLASYVQEQGESTTGASGFNNPALVGSHQCQFSSLNVGEQLSVHTPKAEVGTAQTSLQ